MADQPQIPSPAEFLGGFVIELVLGVLLYGIAVAQIYIYAFNCQKDPWMLKAVVACVATLETLHTISLFILLYQYTIVDFGNLLATFEMPWSVTTTVGLEMCIIAVVQSFYVWRIWILSNRSWLLTFVIGFLLVTRLGFGLASAALTATLDTWGRFRSERLPLFTISSGLAFNATVDLAIAFILIRYLHRNQTGFKKTDSAISILMAYAVNTGAITMVVSLVTALTFAFMKTSLVFAGLTVVAGKLYSNSLLGTLNARNLIRSKTGAPYQSAELSNFQANNSNPVRRHIEIFQETTKMTVDDAPFDDNLSTERDDKTQKTIAAGDLA